MLETKYVSITDEVKKILPEIIKEKNLKIENFVEIVDYEIELDLNKEAIEDIRYARLIKEPENGKCLFFDGNKASVIQLPSLENPKMSVYAYSSINDKNERFILLIDSIFIAFADNNFGLGVTEMLKRYNFKTREEKVKERFREVYRMNGNILDNNNWIEDYYKLYPSIKSSIEIFKRLNKIGLMNVMRERDNVDGEHLFFCSSRYLAKEMGISYESINDTINFLTLLGLIKKVKESDIPGHFKDDARYQRSGQMASSYYIINPITNAILELAEKKILIIADIHERNKMNKHWPNEKRTKLARDTITEERVKQFFGKEEALRVYPNNQELKKEIERGRGDRKDFTLWIKYIEKVMEDLLLERGLPF